MKTLSLLLMLACLPTLSETLGQNAASSDTPLSANVGILLLAHGGSSQGWNQEVRSVTDQVNQVMPTEVAFGMATKSSMQAAVDRLAARKVTEIVAVPLFVSSHSSVIDSISYLLGSRSQAPDDLKMFAAMDSGHGNMTMDHNSMTHDSSWATRPVVSPVPIRMASALDHNQVVADILYARATSISSNPAHEVVILIAHGPVGDGANKLWLKDMKVLAGEIHSKSHFADIKYMTLRDDAEDAVRDAATKQLRRLVMQITQAGDTPLLVPLLLSYGGIEDGLRKRLDGLSYKMPSQALLPDKRISDWVVASAQYTYFSSRTGKR